jgi:hypothetical protein
LLSSPNHEKEISCSASESVLPDHSGAEEKPDFNGILAGTLSELQVTLNICASVSPGDLSEIVNIAVASLRENEKAETDLPYLNTFKSAPPKPTYRYTRPQLAPPTGEVPQKGAQFCSLLNAPGGSPTQGEAVPFERRRSGGSGITGVGGSS